MRICSGAGCLRVIPEDRRYCDECVSEGARNKPSGAQRLAGGDEIMRQYKSPRWLKGTRPRALQRYPLCVDCRARPSQVVDHNIPARIIVAACQREGLFPFDSWAGFYITANLVGRCHSCHNKKTRVEDAQDWSEELDRVLAPYRRK
jgi:5-methylcytosine-specific restriction endonuclease McrA